MHALPESERPCEKCMAQGPEVLSDGELLAVILRSGTKDCNVLEMAWMILDRHPLYKGIAGLYRMDAAMLKEIPGVGDVKAAEILCVLELSKRLSRATLKRENEFGSPEYVAAYYMESLRHLTTEKVLLLLLDGRNRLLKEIALSEGTSTNAYVSVKSIFTAAFRYEAVHLILLHNHPSGYPEPSRDDLLFTRQVKESGELLGIPLTDHIIIGDCCYISMKEEQML